MAEPGPLDRGRAVGPHPHPAPTGPLLHRRDDLRQLLPPPPAAPGRRRPVGQTIAAALAADRLGPLCPRPGPAGAADRLDLAPRPLSQLLDHAPDRRPGRAPRLLSGAPGAGRRRLATALRGSSAAPVAGLAGVAPTGGADRRPRLRRAGPDPLPEEPALPIRAPRPPGHHDPG